MSQKEIDFLRSTLGQMRQTIALLTRQFNEMSARLDLLDASIGVNGEPGAAPKKFPVKKPPLKAKLRAQTTVRKKMPAAAAAASVPTTALTQNNQQHTWGIGVHQPTAGATATFNHNNGTVHCNAYNPMDPMQAATFHAPLHDLPGAALATGKLDEQEIDGAFERCTWPGCLKVLDTGTEYDGHLRMHFDDYLSTPQARMHCCPICNNTLSYASNFRQHLNTHLKVRPELTCPKCLFKTCSQWELRKHKKRCGSD